MTAAAGAMIGLEVHLVLSGDKPTVPTGNLLLSALFGAQQHFTGSEESHWGELEIAREALADELRAAGAEPYSIPIGGSTPVGAAGYAVAFVELMEQCQTLGIQPAAIVHTSSSGGTHAGLLAGRAMWRQQGHDVPEVLAIGVAKGVNMGMPDIADLAGDTIELIGGDRSLIDRADVRVDPNWMGDDYGIPTRAGDAAIRWAARNGGWVLDRVYSGKGFAGLVGNAEAGRWPSGSDVIFIHTGGTPTIFAADGVPPER
jgi:1-aminocyclopropane-1-carboxylate deaminase/D-cysteine desulfhydrase-like pyridoxal-dependent ACC family enzyme